MRHMHALGAVARNSVLDSLTEKSRDGPLLHAHVGVANQLYPASPPKQDVLHHQGRSPTEGQSHFLQGTQDGLSVVGDTWMLQLRQGEGGGVGLITRLLHSLPAQRHRP